MYDKIKLLLIGLSSLVTITHEEVSMETNQKQCIPCEGGVKPLAETEITQALVNLPGWVMATEKEPYRLSKEFRFKNFELAMDFVNQVAHISEEQGHHPDIYIFYNLVRLDLYTHAIDGISQNDLIMAELINELP